MISSIIEQEIFFLIPTFGKYEKKKRRKKKKKTKFEKGQSRTITSIKKRGALKNFCCFVLYYIVLYCGCNYIMFMILF